MKLSPPTGPPELRKMVATDGGLNLQDLVEVLDIELKNRRRRYVCLRLVSRINKLRGEILYQQVINELSK